MALSITSVLTFTVGMFLLVASVILSGSVNRAFRFRAVPIIMGILGLCIFFFGKYMFYIMDYVNNAAPPEMPGSKMDPAAWKAIVNARLYLLYLPDLLLFLVSLALVVDRTKNFAKILAPYGFYFGLLYLVCASFSNSQYGFVDSLMNKGEWYEYLFECDGILRMAPIGFIYLMVISLWVLISCREYSRWSILATVLVGIPLLLYTAEMQLIPDFNAGANCMSPIAYVGLSAPAESSKFEWYDHKFFPNYFSMFGSKALVRPSTVTADPSKMTGIVWATMNNGKNVTSFGTAMYFVIPYVATYFVTFLTIVCKNIFTRDIRRINYIYNPWYYNSRLFQNVCSSIDAKINDWLVKHFDSPYLYGFLKRDMKKINSYARYLQRQKSPSNIDPTKVSEVAQKLESKNSSKDAKKKAKQNKDKINKIEKALAKNGEVAQPNATSILQPTNETKALEQNTQVVQQQVTMMAQEWTDQNGVYWGIDQSGNYFYKQNGQWVAYVAA